MLPVALLKVRCSPRAEIGFLQFEILYRQPLPLVSLRGDTRKLQNLDLRRQLQGLGHIISQIHRWTIDRLPISLGKQSIPPTMEPSMGKGLEKKTFKTHV